MAPAIVPLGFQFLTAIAYYIQSNALNVFANMHFLFHKKSDRNNLRHCFIIEIQGNHPSYLMTK